MSAIADDSVDMEQRVDLTTIFQIIWTYRLLIAAAAVLAAVVATVMALRAIPYYRADVLVTEVRDGGLGSDSSNSALGGLARLVGVSRTSGSATGQDAQAVLQSRRLIEEFIKREKLLPVLAGAEKEPLSLWLATKQFKERVMTIREDPRKGRTTIAIEWTDPQTAARWANGIVALANEVVRARALDDANRNIAYLNKQITRTGVVELQRVMYSLVENEMKTLMLANAKQEYAFTIVDPAVPPEIKSKPQRTMMVILGTLIGTTLGIGLGVLHRVLMSIRKDSAARPGPQKS